MELHVFTTVMSVQLANQGAALRGADVAGDQHPQRPIRHRGARQVVESVEIPAVRNYSDSSVECRVVVNQDSSRGRCRGYKPVAALVYTVEHGPPVMHDAVPEVG